jgi:hypothetical protein
VPPLPILRIARDAYLTPLRRPKLVLASVWLHVLLTLLMPFVLSGGPSWKTFDAGSLVRSVLWCLTAAPVALAWHRHVLLGEPISARSAYRFNDRATRFAVLLLLVDVALSSVAAAMMALFTQPIGDTVRTILGRKSYPFDLIAGLVILFIPAVISTLLFARLVLVFPLRALDRRTRLVRNAWDLSKGNTIRIFAVVALTTVPLLLLYAPALLYMWIIMWESGFSLQAMRAQMPIMTLLVGIGGVPNILLAVPVAASAASLVYRALEARPADAPSPPRMASGPQPQY